MTTIECAREADVIEAIASDQFDVVRDHVDACAICADLVAVVRAVRAERDAACHEARPPSAALVWWRASMRARAEAARVAEQPLSVARGVAGACAIGVVCALIAAAWRSALWFQRIGDVIASLDASRVELVTASALVVQHAAPFIIAFAACLLVAPLAIYLVMSDE
jgi:hypothetical protein